MIALAFAKTVVPTSIKQTVAKIATLDASERNIAPSATRPEGAGSKLLHFYQDCND
jgi:hypothetical protein